jgi:SHS family lactate transporter-like MFS transporter
MFAELRALTKNQRSAIVASFLGWTLDAFDFFILVFIVRDIAQTFGSDITEVTFAILLTLAARPIGALIFGIAADRFGRRPVLMVDVLLYSALEFASGFAPSLAALLILRTLYGVAMGGEWGVGASLTMETIPPRTRGFVSGLLQAGYPTGYLLASVVYFLFYAVIGWRGLFMVGVLPALLVLYIRRHVEESPAFAARQTRTGVATGLARTIRKHALLFVYAVLLMTAFNFFSHGTQDIYPTFLQAQHHFTPHVVGTIAIVYNIGAIFGGILFGSLSERIGRRRAIIIAALLALPLLPLWALATIPVMLALGAFLMQIAVQGAFGVIPVHLNELSPPEVRGTFPGFAYQIGNLLASGNATIQAALAARHGGNYAYAMMLVAGIAAVAVAILAAVGGESRGIRMGPADMGVKPGV